MQRRPIYALAGVALSLGAPTGLLILRELSSPRPLTTELLSDRLTYVYVLVGTALVLAFVFKMKSAFRLKRAADTTSRRSL